MVDCKYCNRPPYFRDGSTLHEGNCAGLKRVDMTQLQHDLLTDRIAALEHQIELFGAWQKRDIAQGESIAQLEAALAKEQGGWDAFLKLRKTVAERDFPGMTAEVTAKETPTTKSVSVGNTSETSDE